MAGIHKAPRITSYNFPSTQNMLLQVSHFQSSQTSKSSDQKPLEKQAILGMWNILSFLQDCGLPWIKV